MRGRLPIVLTVVLVLFSIATRCADEFRGRGVSY
jgi:hypothetical protein